MLYVGIHRHNDRYYDTTGVPTVPRSKFCSPCTQSMMSAGYGSEKDTGMTMRGGLILPFVATAVVGTWPDWDAMRAILTSWRKKCM